MASIEKRGDGYSVRWWEGRGPTRAQRRISRIPTLAEARRIKADVEASVARGERHREDPGARAEYLAAVKDYAAWAARSYAGSTVSRRLGALARYAEWFHGNRRGTIWLDNAFDRPMLEAYHDHITGQKARSVLYANTEVQDVMALWRWCSDDDRYSQWVPRPPSRLHLPTAIPVLEPDAPDWSAMDACVLALEDAGDWHADLAYVCRTLGIRATQAMHLRREELDYGDARLLIRAGLPGSKSKRERKGRIVAVPEHFVETVAGWGPREGWLVDKTRFGARRYVVPDNDNRVFQYDGIRTAWERAKVRRTAWRQPYHAFRKGYVTMLAVAGVPDASRKHLVGHGSDVHGDVYVVWRLLEAPLRDAVAKVPAVDRSGAGKVEQLDAHRGGGR